jgi:hypothetical protein
LLDKKDERFGEDAVAAGSRTRGREHMSVSRGASTADPIDWCTDRLRERSGISPEEVRLDLAAPMSSRWFVSLYGDTPERQSDKES